MRFLHDVDTHACMGTDRKHISKKTKQKKKHHKLLIKSVVEWI